MTAGKSQRINARLPAETARKVAYLERRTKKTTTEVVLESIDRYYAEVTAEERSAEAAMVAAGFVGCAAGAPSLSSDYKAELSRSLEKKA